MKTMQQIATKVFIAASILFTILGITMVLSDADPGSRDTVVKEIIGKLFIMNIFIILSSFALSVAGKYLSSGK